MLMYPFRYGIVEFSMFSLIMYFGSKFPICVGHCVSVESMKMRWAFCPHRR